jgi:hypothetical protein
MHISSWPFVHKELHQSNRQDMVFIRQPGISDSVFQLRIDNIWFCTGKVLLLFSMDMVTDTGMKMHKFAYVSVLDEYKGSRRPGHIFHILYILYICHIFYILHIICIYFCLIVAQLGWRLASPGVHHSIVSILAP